MIWTEEAVAELRRLKADGLSHAEVAERLGTTRNAVGGKWDRLTRVRSRAGRRPTDEYNRKWTEVWSEAKLTEPWSAFAARKRAERARASVRPSKDPAQGGQVGDGLRDSARTGRGGPLSNTIGQGEHRRRRATYVPGASDVSALRSDYDYD